MEWKGKYAEVRYGFHVAITLHDWSLEPDEMNAKASVLTAARAELHPIWSTYEPTAIRVQIGTRWFTYTEFTALSDTLYGVSGNPEVTT